MDSFRPRRRSELDDRMRGALTRHPARVVALGFAGLILLGAAVLALPGAAAGESGLPVLSALFMSASAVSVTGLSVVDTGRELTFFGEATILVLVQVGGIGIMTAASIVTLLLSNRIGIVARLLATKEAGAIAPGDLRRTLTAVAVFSFAVEVILAVVLFSRYITDHSLPDAVWNGVFHSVMAFNNAGFGLASGNLTEFVGDPVVCLAVAAGVILGGLGFPVLIELVRRTPPRAWSLHTKLTIVVTGALLVFPAILLLAFEWTNARTLGPLSVPGKALAGGFHAVMPRTAGFNTIDVGAMREDSWLLQDLLMFVGSGSASTGGGIKVTTFAVLLIACWAEFRGDAHPHAFGRRISSSVLREALVVTVVSLGVVGLGTFILLVSDPYLLDRALFETISAFGTVGLSTGITASLSAVGQLVIIGLMFFGRVGPATLGVAMAMRRRERLFEYPEGRPLVG